MPPVSVTARKFSNWLVATVTFVLSTVTPSTYFPAASITNAVNAESMIALSNVYVAKAAENSNSTLFAAMIIPCSPGVTGPVGLTGLTNTVIGFSTVTPSFVTVKITSNAPPVGPAALIASSTVGSFNVIIEESNSSNCFPVAGSIKYAFALAFARSPAKSNDAASAFSSSNPIADNFKFSLTTVTSSSGKTVIVTSLVAVPFVGCVTVTLNVNIPPDLPTVANVVVTSGANVTSDSVYAYSEVISPSCVIYAFKSVKAATSPFVIPDSCNAVNSNNVISTSSASMMIPAPVGLTGDGSFGLTRISTVRVTVLVVSSGFVNVNVKSKIPPVADTELIANKSVASTVIDVNSLTISAPFIKNPSAFVTVIASASVKACAVAKSIIASVAASIKLFAVSVTVSSGVTVTYTV